MNPPTEPEAEAETEAAGTYSKDVLFDKKTYQQISRKSLHLNPHKGFQRNFLDVFKRKNIQYFGTQVNEQPIPGHLAAGQVELPLITFDQIKTKLRKIPSADQTKLGYIHFGAVRIFLKASFQKGLDTPIILTLMHNRITHRAEAVLGILKGNLKYQTIGFTIYPGYGLPIKDLDTNRALNLCYDFQRTDLLESLHHSPFTIYTMVSYMLSNTHILDKFLDKGDIEIDDIFSDVCELHQLPSYCLPRIEPKQDLSIQPRPLMTASHHHQPQRYSVDGSTLRLHSSVPAQRSPVYQLITKLYTTTWVDGLIWINPKAQQNYVGHSFFPQIRDNKLTYVTILLGATEQIVHIELHPLHTKADLYLGLRFLTDIPDSITDRALTMKLHGSLIQALPIYE